MSNITQKINSRQQFREFITKRGLFGQRAAPSSDKESQEESTKPPGSVWSYIGRYYRLIREHRSRLLMLICMSIMMVILRSSLPWASKVLIDWVLPRNNLTLLIVTCLFMLALTLSTMLISFLHDYLSRTLHGNVVTLVKRTMTRHLHQMPLERLQGMKVGGIISRLQGDTESMGRLLQTGFITPFHSGFTLAIGLLSLLLLNWHVALVCFGVLACVACLAGFSFHVLRPFMRSLRRDRSIISGHLAEVFGGVQVVRAFGQERLESQGYAKDSHLLFRKDLHISTMHMTLQRSIWTLNGVLSVLIWGVGGYFYLQNPASMSLGTLVAFITFSNWLFQPIMQIMNASTQVQEGMACTERIFDLLDEPRTMKDEPNARPIETLATNVSFKGVNFTYPDGTVALDNLDFEIPKGKVTALVGMSGAGKSTITNLIMRFYDVTKGQVQVNGHDIRSFRLRDYRGLISLVLQDIFLFDGTVRANIAYGRPAATPEEVEDAARIANCHDFIMNLKEGYDSIIGERGVKLSGGQRQRLALARGVLVNPQLLILDEATSNLDSESEALIQDALTRILKHRTTLIIAHRLSTIRHADKIVVLEHGRKIEEGTHAELLAKNGRYAEMVALQMVGTDDPIFASAQVSGFRKRVAALSCGGRRK